MEMTKLIKADGQLLFASGERSEEMETKRREEEAKRRFVVCKGLKKEVKVQRK